MVFLFMAEPIILDTYTCVLVGDDTTAKNKSMWSTQGFFSIASNTPRLETCVHEKPICGQQ